MTPYSKVPEHEEDNLTCLCPGHHGDATHKRLADDVVREANDNPINGQNTETARKLLAFAKGQPSVRIGGNVFTFPGPFVPIAIDGLALIEVRPDARGAVSLSAAFFDDRNWPSLMIVNSEVKLATASWDVEWVASHIIVRSAPRNILLDIHFDVESNVIAMDRGRILCNGVEIKLHADYLTFSGTRSVSAHNLVVKQVGYMIGHPGTFGAVEAAAMHTDVDRYTRPQPRRRRPS